MKRGSTHPKKSLKETYPSPSASIHLNTAFTSDLFPKSFLSFSWLNVPFRSWSSDSNNCAIWRSEWLF